MIEKLDHKPLLHLIRLYDRYVIDYPETHDAGCYPVSLDEFYENDYPLILQDFEDFDKKVRGSVQTARLEK